MIFVGPITLGGGKRLYPDDGQARTWTLLDARTSALGAIVARYEPVR